MLPGLRFQRCRAGFSSNKGLVIVTVFFLSLFLFSFLWLDVCFMFGSVRHVLMLLGSSFPASVSTVLTSTGRTAFDRKHGFLLILGCLCCLWRTPGFRSSHVLRLATRHGSGQFPQNLPARARAAAFDVDGCRMQTLFSELGNHLHQMLQHIVHITH